MARDRRGVKSIFDEAAEIASPEERAAYLERACGGDADIRHQVDALLLALDEAGSFLEASPALDAGNVTDEAVEHAGPQDDPAPSVTNTGGSADVEPLGPTGSLTLPPPLLEGPGSMIGPYKLLQKIGEGGMGAVFMAEQEKPVRRKVALKVIKPGMDTAQVIARFEAERQALAIMDHPHIARVLDAGATDSGRPFFVMELVKGMPITEYCDRNHLTPKERLELFIPVCQAIQHAHQKGIIHRDIKPSNVLVTLHDGKPMPKVIDFGVAKAIDQRLTERTMFTEFGQIVGTLEYMSPEQAEMGALDIDTRSDIYSLGVMLYELLTGSTPLERAKLRQAAYADVLKRICEEEPTKPSTRLSESKDALPAISAKRNMEPARLTRLVRGDLDWIVMKSLEKDRTRRYETANGFARDIQRYLDGDPVEASPPSATYKLKKFARKHRVALATAGAFAFLLVAATAVSAGLAVWANQERVRAVKAENAAKEQKTRAEEREQLAIDAVKRYGDVVRETPELKNTPALAPLRAKLLKEPHAFFQRLRDRFQADRETTPESLARLAAASFSLGQLTREIGDKQDALRDFEESLAIRERLAREYPSVIQFQRGLASSHYEIGKLKWETGRPKEAMASYEQTLAIRVRLEREYPSVTEFQDELADSYEAFGNLQQETGQPSEALASYERARAIRERLAREHPESPDFANNLANLYYNIGLLQRKIGQPAKAMASHQQSLAIRERLARDHPSLARFQGAVAESLNTIGYMENKAGRWVEALASHQRARAIRERLAREHPSSTETQSRLADSHSNIGRIQRATGHPAEAMASFQQALTIRDRLARENPSVTYFQMDLAHSYNDIGLLQRASARPAEAMESFERARAIQERLAREHPESPDFASDLGGTLNNMALIDLDERRFEAARDKLTRATDWQRKALATYPDHPAYRECLYQHLRNQIFAAQGLGRADEFAVARRALAAFLDSDSKSVALDARLAAVLTGKETPNDEAERTRLAFRAYEKSRYVASARLYAEAFANDPKLADDRETTCRYAAACAAALAASGEAKDDPPPDDTAKAKLRKQAREWLQAELAAWAKVLDTSPADLKAVIAPKLKVWKSDFDLAGIRDEKELAKLPEDERTAFKTLWNQVDQLLNKAAGTK